MKTTNEWTPGDLATWERIQCHCLDALDDGLPFSRKLAREQGWTAEFTARAIAEYRRFVFLAISAGHEVVPSETVDQVWHLHLLYTEDYWGEFCPKVLGRPLHHGPGRGRRGETQRFRELYAETLASYQRCFGPIDEAIWEPASERFADGGRWRRVDLARQFVLPRPRWPGRAIWQRLGLAAALSLLAAPAVALTPNPLDWSGGEFLLLYLGLLLATILAAYVLRRPAGPELERLPQLGTYEIAYLAGGPDRVVEAALAELSRDARIQWDPANRRYRVIGDGRDLDGPARYVLGAIATDGRAAGLRRRAGAGVEALRHRLTDLGLMPTRAQEAVSKLRAATLFLALIAFGVLKIAVGIGRERPVAFLVGLCFITFVVGMIAALTPQRQTRAGAEAIARLRALHSHARLAPRSSDVALAVAITGVAVLSDTPYAHVAEVRRADGSGAGSGGCSGGGDSGGGSGCSSGCGGCGGGGD